MSRVGVRKSISIEFFDAIDYRQWFCSVTNNYSNNGRRCVWRDYSLDQFNSVLPFMLPSDLEFVAICASTDHCSGKFQCTEQHEQCLAIRRLLQLIPLKTEVQFRQFSISSNQCLQNIFANWMSLHGNNIADGHIANNNNVPLIDKVSFDGHELPVANVAILSFLQNCVATGCVIDVRFRNIRFIASTLVGLQRALNQPTCALQRLTVEMLGVDGTVDFGDDLLLVITQSIRNNRHLSLRRLRLNGTLITKHSVVPFFDALLLPQYRAHLETLDFALNDLCQLCFDKAAQYIASDVCTLTMINLGSNFHNIHGANDRVFNLTSIGNALIQNKTIVAAFFDCLNCGRAGVDMICSVLLQNTTLRTVSFALNRCFIGAAERPLTREQDPFCKVVEQNTTLDCFDVSGSVDAHQLCWLADALAERNLSLTQFTHHRDETCVSYRRIHKSINRSLERNQTIVWHNVHAQLLNFCLLFTSKKTGDLLPPYVLLWIFDWLPWMTFADHRRKIDLIYSIQSSIRRIWKIDE